MSRYRKRLLNDVGRAIFDYEMITAGDRILIGISGGKDSLTLLNLLQVLKSRSPVPFEVVAVNLDQGQPGFQAQALGEYLATTGAEVRMLAQDTYSIVMKLTREGKSYCSLCSRLRRGILYNAAVEFGCTKIALGHHRDDLIETLLMSALYAGQLKSMPPKLHSDDGRNILIRPLAYCDEATIRAYAEEQGFPIFSCGFCTGMENQQRKKVKRLIAQLAEENGAVPGNLFSALSNVVPSHLLDKSLRRVSESPGD